ncbi:hypothetical protein AAHC03_013768 [Spirometra sp. Aus1]
MHSLNQGTTALLTQHPSATYLPLPSVATGLAGPNGRCCATGSPGSPASPATAIALAAAMAASSGIPSTMKDSRWLTLEVCRQFQRKMCSRDENECKFAHPPPQVDVQNGRVICCYDSIKGKCQRRDPPCKYFHPPHHLREQLLQNGRNNLIMKSMQLQLLHQQLLVQGAAMLPLSAATPSGSPVSSAAPLTSAGKLLYPTAPPMNLANHGMASTYSLLLPQQLAGSPAPNSMFEAPTIPLYAYASQMMPPTASLGAPKPLDPAALLLLGSGICPESQLPAGGSQTGLGVPRKRTAACFTETANDPSGGKPEFVLSQPILSPVTASSSSSSSNNVDTNAIDGKDRTVAASGSIENSSGLLTDPLNIFGMANYPNPSRLLSGCAGVAASISPIICTPQSALGVGLGPYLNAMAASSLNPMAALNAAKAAAGPVSLANGSLPQLGLSGMISLPPTPAKRPALADAKSGLPMFQTEVPAVATVPMAATTAGLYALQTASVPQSVSDPSQMSVDATSVMGTADQQTGSLAKPSGQKTEEESSQATSFYPETYIEAPPYGYP